MTLKDELFNESTVRVLGDAIVKLENNFKLENFVKDSVSKFSTLELKERMSCVRENLEKYLSADYLYNIELLQRALTDQERPMFVFGAVLEYVEKNGCNDTYLFSSLEALGELTKKFSAEFAIRPFLSNYPKETMEYIMRWSKNESPDMRRLASEGTRPSLPWAPKITISYLEAARALENLFSDTVRYVTRSVANHLNDISKIDPNYVLTTLNRWKKSGKQTEEEMTYIIHHSLRTLIKKGHKDTLSFLGYKQSPNIVIKAIQLSTDTIRVGDVLEFNFDIDSEDQTKLLIDYRIYYPTKHKKYTSKTYKLKQLEIEPGNKYNVRAKRSFKPISTRTFHEGVHILEVQVNGDVLIAKEFTLIK